MEERRDLNVSGNKVINLKWPTNFDDAATKGYVDSAHMLKPSDNVHEYIRYIINRNDLLHSIAGLVRVKSTMEYKHKNNYQGKDMHFWVESYPECNPADAANICHLDVLCYQRCCK